MAAGRFSKNAAPYIAAKFLNNTNDSVVGGALSAAPSGATGSQYQQNFPGDRIILDPVTALALSNNTVGTLYTGTYRYIGTRNNSTSAPTIGHAAFWDISALAAAGNNGANTATDALYQVTSDEAANITTALMVGVFINNITKGNWGWIQESGKVKAKFRTTITAPTPAIGKGVYATGGGNNANAADVGSFDQLTGANSAAIFTANSTTGYTTVDNMITGFVGVAEALPSNNNLSLIDMDLSWASYRW